MSRRLIVLAAVALLLGWLAPPPAGARNTIRRAFFNNYPTADATRLATLPSATNHCGVCHYAFGGAGPRNPYGVAVGNALPLFGTMEAAIQSLDGLDSDGDGFTNRVEILDRTVYSNTPTFPGLNGLNVGSISGVSPSDVQGWVTPVTSVDTTPPVVTVLSPNGGGSYDAESTQSVTWTATDNTAVGRIDILLSDDSGATYKTLARGLTNSGSWPWFVANLPGTANRVRVVAYDMAGNQGQDNSNTNFTVVAPSRGYAPTTLRDFEMPGTQPFDAGVLLDPATNCVNCHGNYDTAAEPWHSWRGSMMAHAARDPLFFAMVAIVEQEAPSAGDLCLRCHTPGGWQEGRSTDTSGGMLLAKDRQSVQCDFCHRVVDPIYVEGVSPAEDQSVLAGLAVVPPWSANGQFVMDAAATKRGPFADAAAEHPTLMSPYHREGDLCGTCHDVSNPVFVKGAGDHEYQVQALDAKHPDGDRRNMFPVERTFSEWEQSEYASGGVYAPQFAGNKPGGIVATCQDCHMRDVSGTGAATGAPVRPDLPLHDLTGGNTFIPDILPTMFAGEVDAAQLLAGKARAQAMLALAASLDVTETVIAGKPAITVRVTNETGHKLPSGYPEGRRIWLRVRAYDGSAQLIYESGHYDPATAQLTHDEDLKIYHAEPGISARLGSLLGLPAGPSFHFALNDSIYLDNRIPPRGFTNTAFLTVQAAPIGYAYDDGQYWDETTYELPYSAASVQVQLLYQSTSAEFITFLRDANTSNSAGQVMYDAWVAQGKCPPETMAGIDLVLGRTAVEPGIPPAATMLAQNAPNPFNPRTKIPYSLSAPQHVQLRIYDVRGRLVRQLVQDRQPAGTHEVLWDGTDERGRPVDSGVYLARLRTQEGDHLRKMTLLR